MEFIIDQQTIADIKTVLLASKQEVATTQQMLTLLNKLQNLPKKEQDGV